MNLSTLIPIIGQLLTLGFKLAEIIDKADNITPEDKAALKEAIKKAQSGVTYWIDSPISEIKPIPDNG